MAAIVVDVDAKVNEFKCLIGEKVEDRFGIILGEVIAVEVETTEYWQRKFPVLILNNGKRIDISFMRMEDK